MKLKSLIACALAIVAICASCKKSTVKYYQDATGLKDNPEEQVQALVREVAVVCEAFSEKAAQDDAFIKAVDPIVERYDNQDIKGTFKVGKRVDQGPLNYLKTWTLTAKE